MELQFGPFVVGAVCTNPHGLIQSTAPVFFNAAQGEIIHVLVYRTNLMSAFLEGHALP